MQTIGNFECGAVVIGGTDCTVAWRRSTNTDIKRASPPSIMIHQSATADEGVLFPACHIQIAGPENLRLIRDAIDQALHYDDMAKLQDIPF